MVVAVAVLVVVVLFRPLRTAVVRCVGCWCMWWW